VFKDCNIDKLEADRERGFYTRDNFFDHPERRAEFENRLAQSLAARRMSLNPLTIARKSDVFEAAGNARQMSIAAAEKGAQA